MPIDYSQLRNRLWSAADELRANSRLRSHEYSVPVLGLIFCYLNNWTKCDILVMKSRLPPSGPCDQITSSYLHSFNADFTSVSFHQHAALGNRRSFCPFSRNRRRLMSSTSASTSSMLAADMAIRRPRTLDSLGHCHTCPAERRGAGRASVAIQREQSLVVDMSRQETRLNTLKL
jgi:hypothetical protein